MKAKTAMTREIFYLEASDTLEEAYHWMQELHIRHMPILQEGKVLGILSDRDILLHITKKGEQLLLPALQVEEVMTQLVFTCSTETRIGDIADLMIEKKIDAIPILDQYDNLQGMVTSSDLLGLLRRAEGVIDRDLVPFVFHITSPPQKAAQA